MNQFDMSFVHNGVHIMNPTLSEDGRFSVSPSIYGFGIESTGGGCTAWVKKLPTGEYIVLTNGNLSHEFEPSEDFEMGFYDGSEDECMWGNCMGLIEMKGNTK